MLPTNAHRIVLASTSRWRLGVLRDAGICAEAIAPTCDESLICPDDPHERACERALAKARSVPQSAALVIGCDQVCHLEGMIFSKPRSAADQLEQLRTLRGRTHRLSNGVALRYEGKEEVWGVDVEVTLRGDLDDRELEAYVASGDADGCCGGYRAEGLGAQLVERINGDWYSVIGLPLFSVVHRLRERGWRPTFQTNTGGCPPQAHSA
jgi:septum formation protein